MSGIEIIETQSAAKRIEKLTEKKEKIMLKSITQQTKNKYQAKEKLNIK